MLCKYKAVMMTVLNPAQLNSSSLCIYIILVDFHSTLTCDVWTPRAAVCEMMMMMTKMMNDTSCVQQRGIKATDIRLLVDCN